MFPLIVCVCVLGSVVKLLFYYRNGVVKYESVMRLRKKLEMFKKMKGITEDEKGIHESVLCKDRAYFSVEDNLC